MGESVMVVRCPRCGSMDAGSVEAILVELDRMKCHACGHSAVCDEHEVKNEWNELLDEDAVPRERGYVLPDVRFQALWMRLGARGSGRPAFLVLRRAYDEPHRAYHDARHIGACLRLLDDPEVKRLAERLEEVEAALFYHDAIYDTRARDNEERSAVLAEETLAAAGVAPEIVTRIVAHVRATKDHLTGDGDGKLVIDIDLSILGESPDTFARFEEEIRREYAWVEEDAYVAGRSAVLRKFLDRSTIYDTPLFRDRYEARARANIAASIAKLGA